MNESFLAVGFVMLTENEVAFHIIHKILKTLIQKVSKFRVSFLIEIANPMASKKKEEK